MFICVVHMYWYVKLQIYLLGMMIPTENQPKTYPLPPCSHPGHGIRKGGDIGLCISLVPKVLQ